jgi:hypothetical protein
MGDEEVDSLDALRKQVAERLSRLKATHHEDVAQEAIAGGIQSLAVCDEVWENGVPPMPFDQFCIELDGNALYPRQYKIIKKAGLLNAWDWIKSERTLNQLVLMWGKGSGKDYLSAKVLAYLAYVVLHVKWHGDGWDTTAKYFGLASDSQLSIVNVAPSQDHARRIFFRYLSGFLKHKLFKQYKPEILTDTISFYTEKQMEAKKVDGMFQKPLPWLVLYSLHSRASGFDGMNIIGWVMDEADDADFQNPDAVYETLCASCTTRMVNRWIGCIISYPRVKEGFMMRTYETAKAMIKKMGDMSSMIADKAATWDVNPRVTRETPDIVRAYESNPQLAAAMYEGSPMEADDAFFEFPEKIDAAVDHNRKPCAIVIADTLDYETSSGAMDYHVTARVENITRTPGYEYYLGGDSGRTGDAYSLAVFHIDQQNNGYHWLCPRCGTNAAFLNTARYNLHPFNSRREVDDSHLIMCGVCMESPQPISRKGTKITFNLVGWHEIQSAERTTFAGADGAAYSIPTLYEDLIVRIKPERATRQGEVNRPVSLTSVQDITKELMSRLGIRAARFDPWQTNQLTEEIRRGQYGDADSIPFTNNEQYRRARLTKALLYAGLIVLLPNDLRDKEWKQLRLINTTKIDHPDGGSKDIWDSESVAIWTAATSVDSRIQILF